MKYQPSAPPRKRKERKWKAILGKFDPIPPQKTQTVDNFQKDILELSKHKEQKGDFTVENTPWAIGHFLRGWQMDVPKFHRLEANPKSFIEGVHPQIHQKLVEVTPQSDRRQSHIPFMLAS